MQSIASITKERMSTDHKPATIEFNEPDRYWYERFEKVVSPFTKEHFYKPVPDLSHSIRFARRTINLLYADAIEGLNHHKVEMQCYEAYLKRQYPRLFEANNHKWTERNAYLFAKWFSRYYNLVYDHITALRAHTYEVMSKIFPIDSFAENSRVFQLEQQHLDSFITELEKLRELAELSMTIANSENTKAIKFYLLKDARQAIRPTEDSRLNSGFLIWRTEGRTISLDYLKAVKQEQESCLSHLKESWATTIKFGFEPFNFIIEAPYP